MASIQEAIANLGQRIDGQQTQQVPVQEDTQFDTTVPPPPPHIQPATQTVPFTLHSQTEVTPPPAIVPTPISEDPHTRMDRLEQKLRQMRTLEGGITWEDFDGTPMASLLAKFRMPEIERYTGIGCPRIHLRLYSTALYGIEDGIARGLWSESSPTDSKGKKLSGRQRSGNVGAISSAGMRPPRHYQTVGQTLGFYYPPSPHAHYKPPAPSRPMTPTYLHPDSQPVFAAHDTERPPAPYTRPRAPQTTTYVQRPPRQFAQLGMPLSRAFQKLTEGGLLIPLASRPLPQPIPPRFRMDLHCSYHQGPGHDTDHCTALRHAIQDLIDQGLVNLGQPSVTTNPLPAHSTHAAPPSPGDIHHMDLIEDDNIHMLSWDDGLPELIVLHDSYEIDGVSVVP
uniref:Uncharacterized protein n=1 Tax=Vitis vinifera TaxID=29760 RepID=A5AMZ6_VITVI|nr:hypothetical protein VITISV_012200 [Vitis vinifera]